MGILGAEIGFASADRALVDFLAHVFGLEELPAVVVGPEITKVLPAAAPGTQYRLQASDGVVLKVNVPDQAPRPPARGEAPMARAGLRYVTLYVTDLDAVVARAEERGGAVEQAPTDALGAPIAVIRDPDGNLYELIQLRA